MTQLSYDAAGVSIDNGDELVERIKPFAKRTLIPGVLGSIGGFGALFEISKEYKEPVLVSGTDGVGTKLMLAFKLNRHDTVGQDLVAMSVNDVLVQGAKNVFFLDYFSCGKLDVSIAERVVKGVAHGCELAGCALIGGETAEMPGMYPEGEYDLAGFAVGVVEKSQIIDGSKVKPGDVVLGLASSGPHSNGFSLIRKIVEVSGASWDMPFVARSHTEASGSRWAGNHTTDGSTVAPFTHGSSWAFCSTPFCSAQTTVFSSHRARSHPALSAFCVVFTATKTRSTGRVMTAGSVNTGPGTTVSPSSWRRRNSGCAVRPHSSGVRPASCSTAAMVVPIAPGPISAITGLSDMVNSPFR